MDYFPIFCQLENRKCLIVGGGDIAERKALLLLKTNANIIVNAPLFTAQFHLWEKQGLLTLVNGAFDPSLLENCWLAIAATNKHELNQEVGKEAEKRHIFCNQVDSPDKNGFIMPAIIDRSPLIVAISSGGFSPVLSRLLREKFESLLPMHLGKLARYAGQLRTQVKQTFATSKKRRNFWEKFFRDSELAKALAKDELKSAETKTHQLLHGSSNFHGEVTLVGAGPGAADLLTLKGLQKIQEADVILYDRLVSKEILFLARRDAECIFVGKRSRHHTLPQAKINQLLLHHAQQGKSVVRLKGGDPFIFGRGGEELEALCASNISFSVVPGVTAASGCATYAGIPLTHRDYAQSVQFVTGHPQQNTHLDWDKLTAQKQTLVFYMGLSQAPFIQKKLIEHGTSPEALIAIIENGTTFQQKIVTGKLSELGVLSKNIESPALIIIGEVVKLHAKLNWF